MKKKTRRENFPGVNAEFCASIEMLAKRKKRTGESKLKVAMTPKIAMPCALKWKNKHFCVPYRCQGLHSANEKKKNHKINEYSFRHKQKMLISRPMFFFHLTSSSYYSIFASIYFVCLFVDYLDGIGNVWV